MRVLKCFLLATTLALPFSAFAHEGGQHFMGVVKAADEKGLTMETKEKKELRIVFDEKTKFEKAGVPSSAKELVIGERVVVHTAKRDSAADPVAVLVKFGARSKRAEQAGP